MAQNKDFTLKRYNGTAYDVLLPTTHMGQIYTDDALTTTLGTHLSNTYIPLAQKGVAGGVAMLDNAGKIPPHQLSEFIRGGIRIQGTMNGNDKNAVGDLLSELEVTVTNSNGAVTREEMIGYAWIASEDFTLNEGVLPANTTYTFNPGDEGDDTPPIVFESGDMILVSNYSFSSPTHAWTLSVINNNYGVATATNPGIVTLVPTLTNPVDLGGLAPHGNKVVTADTLIQVTKLGGDVYGTLEPEKLVTAGHSHSNYQIADSDLTTLAGLAKTDGNFIVGNGTTWTVESGLTARTSLGLGTLATANTINNTNWNGTVLSIANGGTGASTQSGAKSSLGLGTLASLNTVDNNVWSGDDLAITNGGTGAHTAAQARTNLELGDLATLDSIDNNVWSGDDLAITNGGTGASDATQARINLGLVIGGHVQAFDEGLNYAASNITLPGWSALEQYTTSQSAARAHLSVYSTTEVDDLLINRPQIFYDTTTGAGIGDFIIDLDSTN